MDVSALQQSVAEQLAIIRPVIDHVFTKVRTKANINVSTLVERLNVGLRQTSTRNGLRFHMKIGNEAGHPSERGGWYYPAIGGYCLEPRTPGKQAQIRVVFWVHPHAKRIKLTRDMWNHLHFRCLKTVGHELVHRAQYAKGRTQETGYIFSPHPHADRVTAKDQAYLGDLDEIEAFSREAVEEWYYLYDTPLTHRAIRDQFSRDSRISTMRFYYDTFNGDMTHPTIRRFFRKIRRWNAAISTPIAHTLPTAPAHITQNPTTHGPLMG